MTRVAIAGDIRLYSEGLAEILRGRKGLEVVGVATGRRECLSLILKASPEIVLVDLAMSESLDTIRSIRGHSEDIRVIALAVPEFESEVIACAEAGVFGYVPREASLSSLLDAVQAAVHGGCSCPPRIAGILVQRINRLAAAAAPRRVKSRLTRREEEIVSLIDMGLTNKEIASRLSIATCTVKNHIHRILDKLHVHGRQQAAEWMRRQRSQLR